MRHTFLTLSILAIVFLLTSTAYATSAKWVQTGYRFYTNVNGLDVTDPWPKGPINLGENTPITLADDPVAPLGIMRLRFGLLRLDGGEGSGNIFKLQYAEGENCSSIAMWTDVAPIGGSGVFRGYNNSAVETVDGANISSTVLSVSDIPQTYEEENPSAINPRVQLVGQTGEYDFVVQWFEGPYDTPYCFRAVHENGDALYAYDVYPLAWTDIPYTPLLRAWKWFDDETNETPSTALASENVTPTTTLGNIVKLRYGIRESLGGVGTNIKWRVQFDTDPGFTNPVFAAESADCAGTSEWCYGNGIDVDGDGISTSALSGGATGKIHNESGVSSSTVSHSGLEYGEWEFTLKSSGAKSGSVYYFRLKDTKNESFPRVEAENGYTTSSIRIQSSASLDTIGVATSTIVEGITTDVGTTTSSVHFGSLSVRVPVEAAHQIKVSSSAPNGYSVLVRLSSDFANNNGSSIQPTSGSNATPTAWGSSYTTSALGYHSGDANISGSTRFSADDTYAKFNTSTPEIIIAETTAISDQSTDFVYKIEIGSEQPPGSYVGGVAFILVPTF